MAMSREAARSASFCSGKKPVVPITIFTFFLTATDNVKQRSLRAGKVYQHFASIKRRINVIGNFNPAGRPDQLSRVLSKIRAFAPLEGGAQAQIRRPFNSLQ